MGTDILIFSGIMGSLLLLYLAFGPAQGLVKAIWIISGVGLLFTGVIFTASGGITAAFGIFGMFLGAVIIFLAVSTLVRRGWLARLSPHKELRD